MYKPEIRGLSVNAEFNSALSLNFLSQKKLVTVIGVLYSFCYSVN